MKSTLSLSAMGLILLFASSCKKDSGSGSGSEAITGNWQFIGLSAQTQVTQTESYGTDTYTTISTSDYTTENNTGTVIISPTTMEFKDLSYSISDEIQGETYFNGSLIDNSTVPFDFTLPNTNSTSPYKVIGTDSLYWPAGGVASMNNGVTQPTMASGGKFRLSHDTLFITSSVAQTTNQVVSGQSVHQVSKATEVVSLKRQ